MSTQASEKIGLSSTALLLVGTVIGSSIFMATGYQAAGMGPGVWLVYIIGAVLTIPICFQSAQTGCVLPMTGSNIEMIRRTTGPFSSFMYGWIYICWVAVYVPYCAHSITKFLLLYFPNLNTSLTAIVIIVIFGVVNCFGLKAAAILQNVIVGVLAVAMVVFFFGGIPYFHMENLTPLFPMGSAAVIGQIMPGYFGYVGLFTITEWAGEIENPQKTLPKALGISMGAITVLYILVCVALCAIAPYSELGMDAAVGVVAKRIFPAPVALLINLGAIFAVSSSLNGMMVVLSREVNAMANHGMLPRVLGKSSKKRNAPYAAILLAVAVGIVISLISDSVLAYMDAVTLFIMINCIHSAAASLRIRKCMPQEYEQAAYKLTGGWYYFWPVTMIVTCGIMFVLSYMDVPQMTLPMLAIIAAGVAIYAVRSKRIAR